MLKKKLEEARAAKQQAEKEHGRAAALAAGYQHDLELLRHEVKHRSVNLSHVLYISSCSPDVCHVNKDNALTIPSAQH